MIQCGHRLTLLQAMLPLSDRRRPSNRAAIALHRAQQDRVQAVREEARAAMAVVKDLQVSYSDGSRALHLLPSVCATTSQSVQAP